MSSIAFTIEVVPTQSGALTYNGQAQSPSWNSYNPDTMTLGGVTTGTNAGTYTATFTPKDKYKWSDGTTDAKSVTWTIGKASMAVPSQSGTLTYTGSGPKPFLEQLRFFQNDPWRNHQRNQRWKLQRHLHARCKLQRSDGETGAKTIAWTMERPLEACL